MHKPTKQKNKKIIPPSECLWVVIVSPNFTIIISMLVNTFPLLKCNNYT